MPEMLSIKEASVRCGISYNAIRTWILTGQFKGVVKAGNKYLVNMDRFKDFLNGDGSNEQEGQ